MIIATLLEEKMNKEARVKNKPAKAILKCEFSKEKLCERAYFMNVKELWNKLIEFHEKPLQITRCPKY